MKLEVVHETKYRYTGPIAETAMAKSTANTTI